MSPVNDLPPVKRRARPAVGARSRSPGPHSRSLPGPPAEHLPQRQRNPPAVPTRQPSPTRDRGLGLLIIFTAGVLVMVVLISVTAIIGSWWVLAPVMVVDFAVTASVLAMIVRLLDD